MNGFATLFLLLVRPLRFFARGTFVIPSLNSCGKPLASRAWLPLCADSLVLTSTAFLVTLFVRPVENVGDRLLVGAEKGGEKLLGCSSLEEYVSTGRA